MTLRLLEHRVERTARDWQKITVAGAPEYRFFEAVREWVKRGLRLSSPP
jgi:hypothetical protein